MALTETGFEYVRTLYSTGSNQVKCLAEHSTFNVSSNFKTSYAATNCSRKNLHHAVNYNIKVLKPSG